VSGGVKVTVGKAPSAKVITPPTPAVIYAVVPGPVGGQGEPGPVGPRGPKGDGPFGQITYTDRTIGAEDNFDPGVRQRLMFAPSGLTTQNKLLRPFDTHTFFVDNVLRARAVDDVYEMTVNLVVRSMQAGGKIRVDIDSGSPLGPLQSSTQSLFEPATVQERVSFPLAIQVLSTFLANGALFYLTADRPIQVISETLFLRPTSIQP
jgi:hypothetical protein